MPCDASLANINVSTNNLSTACEWGFSLLLFFLSRIISYYLGLGGFDTSLLNN
jgi:hypothetical protein